MAQKTLKYRKWYLSKRNLEFTIARLAYEIWREKLKPLHKRTAEHEEYVRQVEIYQAKMMVQLAEHLKLPYRAKPNWVDRLVVCIYEWATRERFEEYKLR